MQIRQLQAEFPTFSEEGIKNVIEAGNDLIAARKILTLIRQLQTEFPTFSEEGIKNVIEAENELGAARKVLTLMAEFPRSSEYVISALNYTNNDLDAARKFLNAQGYWLPDYCAKHLTLSKQNTVVTKTSGGMDWNATVLGKATAKFAIKIIAGMYVAVGMAPNTIKLQSWIATAEANVYVMYTGNNGTYLYGSGKDAVSYNRCSVEVGTVIGVMLNRTTQEISFSENGKDLRVAFRNVTACDLFPAVLLRTEGDIFEFVSPV